jgi:hypothetical protein
MVLSKLTLGRVAIAWAVFLIGAAVALPPIDSRTPVHPAVTVIVFICCALLLIATPIAVFTYFNQAWRKIGSVPNKSAYAIWLGLESIVAVSILSTTAYAVISVAIARLR